MATEKETFQIIRDPGPVPQARSSGLPKYPFGEIDVGQAFDVPCGGSPAEKVRRSIACCTASQKRRHGRNYVARTITREDGVKVIRCWRIA